MHCCEVCENETAIVSDFGLCPECQAKEDREVLESPFFQEFVKSFEEEAG